MSQRGLGLSGGVLELVSKDLPGLLDIEVVAVLKKIVVLGDHFEVFFSLLNNLRLFSGQLRLLEDSGAFHAEVEHVSTAAVVHDEVASGIVVVDNHFGDSWIVAGELPHEELFLFFFADSFLLGFKILLLDGVVHAEAGGALRAHDSGASALQDAGVVAVEHTHFGTDSLILAIRGLTELDFLIILLLRSPFLR